MSATQLSLAGESSDPDHQDPSSPPTVCVQLASPTALVSNSAEEVFAASVVTTSFESEPPKEKDDRQLHRCDSGHPVLNRSTSSSDSLERPKTCKLSATLRKRSHNHYIPSCMELEQINVFVKEVSVNLQDISDIISISGSSPDEQSVGESPSGEPASLTSMLKEVRVLLEVKSRGQSWTLIRHLHQLVEFDEWLHRCCLQRYAKYNNLFDLRQTFAQSYRNFAPSNDMAKHQMLIILQYYFRCFSSLSNQMDFCAKLVCPLALDILDLDCKGHRLSLADRYNTQGIELAVAIRDFKPSCEDELELSKGDYLAVTYVTVNMDSPTWWEGKIVRREDGGIPAVIDDLPDLICGTCSDVLDGGMLSRPSPSGFLKPRRIGFFPSNYVKIVGPGETPTSASTTMTTTALVNSEVPTTGVVGGLSQQQQQPPALPPIPKYKPPLPYADEQFQQQQQQQVRSLRAKYPRLLDSLRAFFRSRPEPSALRRTGILRNGLFGSDLASYLGEYNLEYPRVLTYCTQLIESHGTKHEGLYRKSGNGAEIQRLVQLFECGNQPEETCTCGSLTASGSVDQPPPPPPSPSPSAEASDAVKGADQPPTGEDATAATTTAAFSEAGSGAPVCPLRLGVHNYTNLLKTYFRELAVPLLSAQFVTCTPEVGPLKECVAQMSPVNFRVAQYLFRHLKRMAGHSERTLMHSHNLALVWAPNLCQQLVITSAGGVSEASRISLLQANVVACMIDNCESLFVQSQGLGPSSRVVLDVIMPVQAPSPRGFDRANPLGASIRRNSSASASSSKTATAAASAKAAKQSGKKAAAAAGSSSHSKSPTPKSAQSSAAPAGKKKRRPASSASSEDPQHPPPTPPSAPPSQPPASSEALDLAISSKLVQDSSPAALSSSTTIVVTAVAPDEEPIAPPKVVIKKKAARPQDVAGGSRANLRRADSSGSSAPSMVVTATAPKITIKHSAAAAAAAAPVTAAPAANRAPHISRADSVTSSASNATPAAAATISSGNNSSSRMQQSRPNQQRQQQQH